MSHRAGLYYPHAFQTITEVGKYNKYVLLGLYILNGLCLFCNVFETLTKRYIISCYHKPPQPVSVALFWCYRPQLYCFHSLSPLSAEPGCTKQNKI